MSEYEGLTDQEVRATTKALSGVPKLNIGAFFLPPVWGPGHGIWLAILWYPLWLLADNLLFAAYSNPTKLSVSLAVAVLILLAGFTALFARLMQVKAFTRALSRGMSKEEYVKRERVWAVACVAAGIVLLCVATYYNVFVRVGV